MNTIKLMVNGVPGNVAKNLIQHVQKDIRFNLIGYSLTGPEITETEYPVNDLSIRLIQPHLRDELIPEILRKEGNFISIDFTHPSAVNDNAEFYRRWKLPFVMGTTGGDRKRLENTVNESDIPAVIAPNMAKQIVAFQSMLEYAAQSFPDLFKGYTLQVKESHQNGKADTSGTAKAVVASFQKLGIDFPEDQIIRERNPEIQKSVWGVPEDYLKGHAWHTYTVVSEDNTVKFEFTHNVNGRDIYARGILDAAEYLYHKVQQGERGKVFTMMDVLKKI